MPSPFPGMDPYLEDPAGWPDVHITFIAALRDHLTPVLLPNFYVRIQERVYISSPEDPGREALAPDLFVLLDPEIHDHYLEIYDARSREIVTAIDVLSPANKTAGADGREAFRHKRKALLSAGANWIEIDLLRAGWRRDDLKGRGDYDALLARAGKPTPVQVWFFNLRDKLPTILVPLRPPFDDVALDLQAAFNEAYDRAQYGEMTDYTAPGPPPGLRPADVAWVEVQLREWRAARAGRAR